MLDDDQYKLAVNDRLPVLSPKDIAVWVAQELSVEIDEDGGTSAVKLTCFETYYSKKHIMDTDTFKEFFTLDPDFDMDRYLLDNRKINAAKQMGYIK